MTDSQYYGCVTVNDTLRKNSDILGKMVWKEVELLDKDVC